MNEVTLQIILAVVMFTTTAVAGLIPLKLLRVINKTGEGSRKTSSWILTLLSCFAGGVFMGTCFLDIFPHVNGNYEEFKSKSGFQTSYPFPEFFACCGFFLVYFLEEISLKVFSSHSHHGHSHGHSNAEQPLKTALPTVNGHPRGSVDEGSLISEKIKAVMTHEIVMDKTVEYVSDDNQESGILKSITFAIAMSFHSILEGFALGVQNDRTGIMTFMVTSTIIIYALMTPVGSMLGVLLTTIDINPIVKDGAIVVLEGLAGGTFIYVTFFEVLAQERANDHSNLVQLNAIVVGFLVIAGLQLNEHGFPG